MLVALCAPGTVHAQATTERVVVNRFTGLAISGFDPVAYFTEAAAARGFERFEAVQDGAVWRFRNEGNRAAFLGHPEVYAPQFGGYDPVDVGRGKAVEGLPQLWTVYGRRLYLFASTTSKAAFAADPDGFAASAGRRWPKLKQELSQ
ncbi:YHS domain-containing (seleno)protein [Bradyrhizobium sp. LHD-71]|nr:YHS domain-containing (seleno)protein [Bradyrhizobium sp. LHD-71]MDQ8732411.1 YHS domain-containing (seleno)protein [Bradyrhizobium sp. LHD-71]